MKKTGQRSRRKGPFTKEKAHIANILPMTDSNTERRGISSMVTTRSPEETEALGQTFGKGLKVGDVVAFFGELGSGKTTFIRGVCREFGVVQGVKSPSFIYMRRYDAAVRLYHFDLYRLTPGDDMMNIDLEQYFYADGIVLVEWADRAQQLLPAAHYEVRLSVRTEREREIYITSIGEDGREGSE